MSTPSPEWKDLERLWQSTPAAKPAKDIIERQLRRRWASYLVAYSEVAIALAGAAVSIWVMTLDRPYALLIGGGALLLTIFASAASLWARFLPRRAARPEESVTAALDAAIERARVSTRWGFATFWIVAACLVFFAVLAFVWAGAAEHPPGAARRMLISLAIGIAWIAVWQVFALFFCLRRARELARLEEIKRSLGSASS